MHAIHEAIVMDRTCEPTLPIPATMPPEQAAAVCVVARPACGAMIAATGGKPAI